MKFNVTTKLMNENSANIKDRVLQFADSKEDSKQIFFKKTGLKYGNFTSKSKNSDLGSKSLAEILAIYPDVDLHWLITGEKKKEDTTGVSTVNEIGDSSDAICKKCTVLERELAHSKELVQAKNETIASLQRALEIIGDRNGSSKAS